MSFKLYSSIVVMAYAIVGVTIATLGYQAQDYRGDLTRLGGYRESDFGWTAPQQGFASPLYSVDHIEADLDLLVLGDSMSLHRPGEQTQPGTYWPNWLAAQTGWRIGALRRTEFTIDQVLQAPVYRANPPKLLLLEMGERTVTASLDRVAGIAQASCEPVPAASSAILPPPAPMDASPVSFDAPPAAGGGIDMSIGAHQLKTRIERALLPSMIQTVEFGLDRDALFSNAQPQRVLVFRDDMLKLGLEPQVVERLRCGLMALQRKVEADGRTRFAIMIVPDKTTAYRQHIVGLPAGYPELIAQVLAGDVLPALRVDQQLAVAVERGTVDLYLPNDTHIGVAGHRLLAETALRELEQRGWVRH